MVDQLVKISEFTEATSLVDADHLTAVASGANVKITWANVKTALSTAFASVFASLTGNNTFSGNNTLSGTNTFSGVVNTVYRPGFVSGRYYAPEYVNSVATATAGQGIGSGTNTVAVPFYVGVPTTFDRIGVCVGAAVGGSTVQLGIYNTGSNGRPSTRVLDAGTVSAATTGAKEATISQLLTPGWYWLAMRASSSSIGLSVCNFRDGDIAEIIGLASLPTGTLSAAVTNLAYEDTAAIPATFTTTPTILPASATTTPAIFLRAA